MSTPRPSRGSRSLWWSLAVLAALAVGLLGAVVAEPPRGGSVAAKPAASAARSASVRAAGPDDRALTMMFEAMSRAVAHNDRADFIAAAGSTPWARQTWHRIRSLGVDRIDLRYGPDDAPRLSTADVSVAVAWSPGSNTAYDGTTTVPRHVTFTVACTDTGTAAVIGAGGTGDFWLPAWLIGDMDVRSLGDATVVSTGRRGSRPSLDVLTRRALAAVRTALAGSDVDNNRRVVVVAPATEADAVRLGGRELRGAAAVTTTVDGSPRAYAPVHVVLNPTVFDRLTRRGAQVVLTHEVTHAVTGAAASTMPLWVAEGFADWIALRDASLSLDVTTGRLSRVVRQEGLPAALPVDAEFAGHRSSHAYEASWTAFHLLSRRAGDRAVLGFYADVQAGQPVAAALELNTGLDVAEVTRAWRMDVRRFTRD